MTLRVPGSDATRSRWEVAPEWLAVQNATLRNRSVAPERVHASRVSLSLERLQPRLTGSLARLAVISGTDDIEEAAATAPKYVRDYEIKSGRTFADRVAEFKRQAAFG